MEPVIAASIIGGLATFGGTVSAAVIATNRTKKKRIITQEDPESAPVDTSTICESRSELPGRDAIISKAQNELCLMCIHATTFLQEHGNLLQEKLNACRVRILMMSKDVDGNPNHNMEMFQKTTLHEAVGPHLEGMEILLADFSKRLSQTQRDNLEVRLYTIYPSAMYLLADMHTDNGIGVFEPLPPNMRIEDRPALKILKADKPLLAKNIYNSFNSIWNRKDTIKIM